MVRVDPPISSPLIGASFSHSSTISSTVDFFFFFLPHHESHVVDVQAVGIPAGVLDVFVRFQGDLKGVLVHQHVQLYSVLVVSVFVLQKLGVHNARELAVVDYTIPLSVSIVEDLTSS